MNYRIEFGKRVVKFLDRQTPSFVVKFIKQTQKISQGNVENLDITKLKGKENCFRLRIGKYRFLYEVREKEIIVYFFDAGSRGDIYKKR